MHTLAAAVIGFFLDLPLGDPPWLPHPVRLMGWIVERGETYLRRALPKTPAGELWGGAVLALAVAGLSFAVPFFVLQWAGSVSFWLRLAIESLWCWQIIAAQSLKVESMAVHRALAANDLPSARLAVSRIVGRDTEQLTAAEVARAAVETVAENASDGVIAPLCYTMLGGAPLGFLYKAVSTMDSMIGYKNERYLYFGRCAARADDVLNLLPARLTALLFIASAHLLGLNSAGAFLIWRRDRRNHKSPNSGHPEAACAGALGLQLGGDSRYFGELVHKPTIGDAKRAISPEDIPAANRLMYTASWLALALFCALRLMGELV